MVNLTNIHEQNFKNVESFWGDAMPMKTMEECGELIQALSKFEVFNQSEHPDMTGKQIEEKFDKFRNQVMEELRDVYISLECIKLRYGFDENELNWEIQKKLNKQY